MSVNRFFEREVAGRWLAGPEISDAVRSAAKLNRQGIRAIINYLGEEIKEEADVEAAVSKYVKLIKEIKERKLKADITMKPTQIGLALSKALFKKNYLEIVNLALKSKVFVWLDMEGPQFVEDTIDVYVDGVDKGNTGICIQAYLKRSHGDLERLARHNSVVRLVRGAHRSKEELFYSPEETTHNYYRLMDYLFAHFKSFTIGTHDSDIIERAAALNMKYERDLTIAMLTGIRSVYAAKLASDGYNVSVYVTFGEKWVGYSYRRIKELSTLKIIIRSLFGD